MANIERVLNDFIDVRNRAQNRTDVVPDDPDAWYWQLIDKYKDNPEAYAYLSTNPNLRANIAPFSPNIGQQVAEMFGDTSARDAYYADYLNKAHDFFSQWESGQYEQHYNSPIEQVRRERAAGINPDLAPQNISSGDAAENDQPFQSTPMHGAGDSSFLSGIANFGIEFVSNILSFGERIQALNIGAQNKISAELANSVGASDYVLNQLAGIEPAKIGKMELTDIVNSLDLSSYSKSTAKFIKRYLKRYDGNTLALAGKVAEFRNRKLQNESGIVDVLSDPYFNEDLNVWASDVADKYTKVVAAAEQLNAWNTFKLHDIKHTFLSDENNQNILGSTMAAEANASYDSAKAASEYKKYEKEMNAAWNELIKVVKGDGKHWYNTIGQVLMFSLRSQLSAPLHLGFSSSIMDTVKDKDGSTHSYNRSRSFHF